MRTIQVICYDDEETGEILVSHGIDTETLKTVILSNDRPRDIGAVSHPEFGLVIYLGDDEA